MLRRDRDFSKLWIGQAISQTGSRITREGLPLTAVLTLGATPFQMGILSGASAGVVLLFGLFAGVWVDRLRRRPLLIFADLARAAVLSLVPLLAVAHRLTIYHLYAIGAASAILTVLFDSGYQAYLPSLVPAPQLLDANSKLAMTESAAEVIGPGLTGVLVQLITAPIAMLIDAASFVVSAISIAMIGKREPPPDRRANPHIGREIHEGLAATWDNPVLRALAIRTASVSFFMGFFASLYILFAMRDLRLNALQLGIVITVGGVGNVLGTLITSRLAEGIGIGRSLILAAIIPAFFSLLIPLAHGPVWMCVAFLIAAQVGDVAWPIYNINETTLRQAITPSHLLGRVNSAAHLLFRGILPAGAFVAGAVAQRAGVRTALFIGSAGFLISSLWLVFSPIRKIRQLHEHIAGIGTVR